MIVFSERDIKCRYLRYSFRNGLNDFKSWLEHLDINKLPYNLTIEALIKNKLINPILRIDLPKKFYLLWHNYPCCPCDTIPQKYEWCGEYDLILFPQLEDIEWFLHPYDKTERLEILNHTTNINKPYPKFFEHTNGVKVHQSNLYFSYWQAFYLIDLFETILFPLIPNVGKPKKSKALLNEYNQIICCIDSQISFLNKKWEQYIKCFELISYYRTISGIACSQKIIKNDSINETMKKASKELAQHLKTSPNELEDLLQSSLLILFQKWEQDKNFKYPKAIKELQKDIYFLLEWICNLNGNNFEFYFEKIKRPNTSVQLSSALPYEYYKTKDSLLKMIPNYLKEINMDSLELKKLQIITIINKLWDEIDSFHYFASAFHLIHKQLKFVEIIGFENDYFMNNLLVIALRTEAVLFELLNSNKAKTLKAIVNEFGSSLFHVGEIKETFIEKIINCQNSNDALLKYIHNQLSSFSDKLNSKTPINDDPIFIDEINEKIIKSRQFYSDNKDNINNSFIGSETMKLINKNNRSAEDYQRLNYLLLIDLYPNDLEKNHLYDGIKISLENWQLTNYQFPDDPYEKINNNFISNHVDENIKEFAKHILTFGVTRNYLAHKSYFDKNISPTNKLTGKIFKSIIVSLFYFAAIKYKIKVNDFI